MTISKVWKLDCSPGLAQPQTNTFFFAKLWLPNFFFLDTGKLRWWDYEPKPARDTFKPPTTSPRSKLENPQKTLATENTGVGNA